ncbi:GTP cyclohydrolase I [Penicillium malachiteum]|uniref:GTP cyclohydrolase I n=1 Tax=Penicillium malachiteum TaxID=1324776 RepID=UPI002547A9EB|nr:GTP cyclohydrolase I [Penicillium malachiteum]KAJ5720725.1 GTP cyclohydrolase I [Penicillium malachiteum]
MDTPIDRELRYHAENEDSNPNSPVNPPASANIAHSLQTMTLLRESDVRFQPNVSTIQIPDSSSDNRTQRLTGAIKTILECIGEDAGREGLRDTPQRYAKAMLYFTKGYGESIHSVTNGAIFNENYQGLVVVKDIDLFSLCEHHMIPFLGKVHIGYIPNGQIIGLSKLPRIVEMLAHRLQVQERLTGQIGRAIFDLLQPHGVGVVMECSHLCMQMRGVQKVGSSTTTSFMLGCLEMSASHREEFFSALKK